MTTMYDLTNGAIEELQEYLEGDDHPDQDQVSERIYEIADSRVPIYNYDLLEVAQSNLRLAASEPELWPAFNGTATPVNLIAANIYEMLYEELQERLNNNRSFDEGGEELQASEVE